MSLVSNDKKITYGIDIGGTKIEIGLFTSIGILCEELQLLDSWRVATPTDNYDEFIQAIVSLVADADQRTQQQGVIGIGMPGIRDKHGKLKSANVPCATGKSITEDLSLALNRQVVIGNDCQLFTLSESCGGAGKNHTNVYGAIIGTGAAGGLCINGRLYTGKNGFAGEYGHLPVSAPLIQRYNLPIRNCGCGLKGCYECYIAGPGLAWLYQHFGAENGDTHHFIKQLRNNDPIAKETFACYMEFLGASFATIVLSYDPDIIVVGGGLSKIDEIVEALPQYINHHLFKGVESPPVQRAVFGDSSGVRGAAILRNQQVES